MAKIDYVVEWFFPQADLADHRVQSHYSDHWTPCGCQWLVQYSPQIAKCVMLMSLRDGPEATIEDLQVALNDVVAGRLVLLAEDGVMGPKTVSRLKTILESLEDAEVEILRILSEF